MMSLNAIQIESVRTDAGSICLDDSPWCLNLWPDFLVSRTCLGLKLIAMLTIKL